MDEKKPITQEATSEAEPTYFGMQASWGFTKHMGGQEATEELVELCHINKDSYVLEVGCGVGLTPCYLARKHGCRVVGIDLSEGMIDWSNKRAKRERVQDRVEFRVADAQQLPFEEGLFDAVITESVTAFVPDKPRALAGFVRVLKPGGYIGLNEGTWVKPSPPPDLVRYLYHTMAGAEFLPPEGWRGLLEGAGLQDIVLRTYKINALSQWKSEFGRMGFADFLDYFRAWGKFLSLFLKSSAFRKWARQISPSPRVIRDVFGYFGYGIYVGRKQTL